jgi:hypothetical protein
MYILTFFLELLIVHPLDKNKTSYYQDAWCNCEKKTLVCCFKLTKYRSV